MDRGVEAVRWVAALQGGKFDGERKQLLDSELLDEPPGTLRAYDCPCCGRCATPLPGSVAELQLEEQLAPWVPYRLTQVVGSARIAIYVPADEAVHDALRAVNESVRTPDLIGAM